MNAPPRNPPRFLPTLTEVVDPASLGLSAVSLQPELDELVRSVMRSVEAELEQRVRDAVQEHVQTVHATVREAMEPLVRQLVSQALARMEGQETTK